VGIPFTIVEGVIFIADKYGNIVDTREYTGEVDSFANQLRRILADSVSNGVLDDTAPTAATEGLPAPVRITAQRAQHVNLRNDAGTEIGTSTNPLALSLADFLSTNNSTTTPLSAAGVFTGAGWDDLYTLGISTIVVSIFSSHASASLGFKIQFSSDGVNVDAEKAFNIAAMTPGSPGENAIYTFGKQSRYFRIVYTNGATLQTSFRLQTILSRVPIKNTSVRVENTVNAENDAELVKSIMAGRTPTGIFRNINVDETGNIVVNTVSGFNAAFTVGFVATSATTRVAVRSTTFVEQTTNAQRSISSANANDTAAGTGARTVRITYYDQAFAGPFSVTLTLNGVTPVNTVAADISYVEKMEVLTAGSTGSNVGIISLFGATAGGGGTIGTIAATLNQTFWTHHYVPTGKTAVITGFIGTHSNTVVGGGGMFVLLAKDLSLANSVERQVSDFLRVYGQASSTPRNYSSPIKVIGPARILAYVTPETASSSNYRAAFDYFEQTT
jgi:hypothetical protein